MVTTIAVTLVPALLVAGLRSVGVVSSWLLGIGVASSLSLLIGAAGSAWWVRRPASRDIVFADLMIWGWWRRRRTERRLAEATWLLGRVDRDRQTELLGEMSATLEARDPYTHGHSKRVTRHAHMIARAMGLPPEQAARVRTAAALHDVGKAQTPRELLNKPGRLTDDEFAIIKRHPVDGAEMVAGIGDPEVVAIIRHHHERLDGGGYPDGLSGAEIPLGARIIAVADTFDALTSTRPYRSGCRHKKALDILRKEAGTQLDPNAVAAFLRYYSGRRAIPGWGAAVAVAPPRLGAWLSSAVNSIGSAPLGGAAALGAGFLVSGALVVPSVTSQMASAASAGLQPVSAGPQAVAQPVPAGSSRQGEEPGRHAGGATGEGRSRSGARGARERGERPEGAETGAGPGGSDAGAAGRHGSGEGDGHVEGQQASGSGSPASGPDAGAGGGSPGGSPPGGGSGGKGVPGLPEVELPPVPGIELPPVKVPPVRVPPVEVPPVKVGPVETPSVQLPPVQVPPVAVPPVKLPSLKPRLPGGGG